MNVVLNVVSLMLLILVLIVLLSGCGTRLERTPDGRGITVCGGLS